MLLWTVWALSEKIPHIVYVGIEHRSLVVVTIAHLNGSLHMVEVIHNQDVSTL